MAEESRVDKLYAVVAKLIGRELPRGGFAGAMGPFDTSPPNQHESKAEFLAEKNVVLGAIKHIDGLWEALVARGSDDDTKNTLSAIRTRLDRLSRGLPDEKKVETASDLVLKNAREIGLTFHSLVLAIDLQRALRARAKELEDQESEFWSTKSRPPKYYARTIALRLARLYARETGERPTVGTSREGGHPSTDFARAVEEVFEILDIDADVRRPAKWAVSQLTDEDLMPEMPAALGGLLRFDPFGGAGNPDNALSQYVAEKRTKG